MRLIPSKKVSRGASALGVATAAVGIAVCVAPQARNYGTSTRPSKSEPVKKARMDPAHLPLAFEPNQGQASREARFVSTGAGYQLTLNKSETVLTVSRAQKEGKSTGKRGPIASTLRIRPVGANPNAKIVGTDRLPGVSHYYLAGRAEDGITNIPHFGKVRYESVYPGIDLVYYGNQGRLEYDFVVAPGIDPGVIQLQVDGADRLQLAANGEVVMHTAAGEVRQHKPVIYQEVGGQRKPVDGRCVLLAENRIGFEVAAYDASRPLVLDPVLTYGTFRGGTGNDVGLEIAVDGSGNAYMAGSYTVAGTPSVSYGWISKLNSSGTALLYNVGIGVEAEVTDVALDSSAQAYITGYCESVTTTSGAFQQATHETVANDPLYLDAFAAKLSTTGTVLYATYISGGKDDFGYGIAVDGDGRAHITGATDSGNFPESIDRFQGDRGDRDAFVIRLNAAGSAKSYSTYLGGADVDEGHDITIDLDGRAVVTGFTYSTNYPTQDALQGSLSGSGSRDAFVTKVNLSGTNVPWSTYLGGTSGDFGSGIACDANNDIYVAGETSSSNFPTASAYQSTYGGGTNDAFVTKINGDGSSIAWSSFYGGSSDDGAADVAVGSDYHVFITGRTASSNLPTASAIQGSLAGAYDAFVAEFTPPGMALTLTFGTYLGGSTSATSPIDVGTGIALDSNGDIYVTGQTWSTDFPTTMGALQTTHGGGDYDGFMVKITR